VTPFLLCRSQLIGAARPADSRSEGPAVQPTTGRVYFSDIGNQIYVFEPATNQTGLFLDPSGRSNGLMFDKAGNQLFAAQGANTGGLRQIAIINLDGAMRTLSDNWRGKRFNSPNDLVIDSLGRVYFTDPRYVGDEPRAIDFEGVFLVHPDGKTMLATAKVEKPNGIIISPDGTTVYVADHNPAQGGAKQLLAFTVMDDGTLAGKRVLYDFGPGRRGIDGMAIDVLGNIYATAGTGDRAGVYVFAPTGEHLALIKTPGDPTNCTFGIGDEHTTLYITAQGPKPTAADTPRRFGLFRIRLAIPGHHLP